MEEPPQFVTHVTVLAPVPFHVLDAAVGRWLAAEFIAYSDIGGLGQTWTATSSGSSHHTLARHGRPLWHITLAAVDLSHSSIQLAVLQDAPGEALEGQLAAFWHWFLQQPQNTEGLPRIEHLSINPQAANWRALTPDIKRPGPVPRPYTVWAREQSRAGRTIDEMLSEYMERRGEDPNDLKQRAKSREILRKTLSRLV